MIEENYIDNFNYYYSTPNPNPKKKKIGWIVGGISLGIVVLVVVVLCIVLFSQKVTHPYTAISGGDTYYCEAVHDFEDTGEKLCVVKRNKLGVYVDEYWKN